MLYNLISLLTNERIIMKTLILILSILAVSIILTMIIVTLPQMVVINGLLAILAIISFLPLFLLKV